jgi:type IV pilus assembly protein PilM
MFFSKKKEIVGIDIGSSSVKLVQLKEQKGTYILQNVGVIPLPAEAIVDNTLMDSSSIVETVKKLVQSLSVKANLATCSIAGNSVIIRKISMPTMLPQELEEQIQWEAEQYIPFDINDVNIDFHILEGDQFLDKNDPSRMNVMLVASKKDIINDYAAVFNEVGIKLAIVDVDAFAIQNAYELNYDNNPEDVVALINVGASIMNINIVKNGVSLFTRDVQMGGNLYTEEIQKLFGVSTEEAEKIKVTGEAPNRDLLEDTIVRTNETLALEMRRSLDFYNTNASEEKIKAIYLSGGGSKASNLIEAVSTRINLPVELLDPFHKVKYSEKDFDPEYLHEIGPLVVVAMGLATRRPGDK